MKWIISVYNLIVQSIIAGIQGRNPNKVGTSRQELMERPWRSDICCPAVHLFSTLLLHNRQSHHHRHVIVHRKPGPPTLIFKQENVTQVCLHANYMKMFSQFRFLLS